MINVHIPENKTYFLITTLQSPDGALCINVSGETDIREVARESLIKERSGPTIYLFEDIGVNEALKVIRLFVVESIME